jgi:hypothetical protein
MTSRLLFFSLLLLSAFLFAACGGGGAGNEDARLVDQFGLSLDVIEDGGAEYALSVQEAETVLVDVRVENAVEMTRSFVELKYDAELITPLRVMDGGFLGADTLFLQVTDRPGKVPVAAARIGDDPEGVSGRGVIARIEFARGAFPGRSVSACPGRASYTSIDLDQDLNTITVNWTDDNAGDTNADRHLNGNDVFPIALNFGKSDGEPGYAACIDGNADGIINGNDVFPLAIRYDMRFGAYNVYWDVTPTMDEAFVPENTTPIPVDYAGGCRGEYGMQVGPLADDNQYFIGITTLDQVGGVESDFCVSDPLVLGTPDFFLPATDFWGENYGDRIFLDWEKPVTPERIRGYHVFRQPPLGSFTDISGKIASTQFDDYSIADLDTGDYVYHVVVEYDDEFMSDPTSNIAVHWERTNNEPWINEVTTTNYTMAKTDVLTATLHVDGDDGEGGDNVTWTWTIESGSGTFPAGNTGETVQLQHTASSTPEKIVVRVTGEDGTTPCTETIRLVYVANYPRIKIGTSGPADGHFVDFTLEDMKNGGNVNFANDVFVRNNVVLMNFWASW